MARHDGINSFVIDTYLSLVCSYVNHKEGVAGAADIPKCAFVNRNFWELNEQYGPAMASHILTVHYDLGPQILSKYDFLHVAAQRLAQNGVKPESSYG